MLPRRRQSRCATQTEQTQCALSYAPYNFFPAITDTLVPLYLLGLLYAYWRSGGLDGKLVPET